MTLIRQVHNSQYSIICPVETPEGKEACGILKNFALLTNVSLSTPHEIVEDIVSKMDGVISIKKIVKESECRGYVNVLLNGSLIGFTKNGKAFLDAFRNLRRDGLIFHSVSVGYKMVDNEINIFSDEGRCMCPLFRVEKDGSIPGIVEKHLTYHEMIDKGYIVYIDSNENESSYVAPTVDDVVKNKWMKYDYCQLDPSLMLGIAASTIPHLNRNQGPRNSYQSSMCKQALGMYSTGYANRMETTEHTLQYCQKAMVDTRAAKLLKCDEMAAGQSAIVAFMCYTGSTSNWALVSSKERQVMERCA
jgi:DNA-directed RNA polymerase beta subunit